MLTIELIYAVFALMYITYAVCKAKNKLIIGLFAFWLFAYPILTNPKYEIRIPVINFALLPNRLVLPPLLLIVFLASIRKIRKQDPFSSRIVIKIRSLRYEKWIAAYMLAVLISEIINYDTIGSRTVLQIISDSLFFVLFYFSIRSFITDKDFNLLLRSIVVFAMISAFVGFIQFLIDPGFLRIGVNRWAFDQYIRSNGLFSAEYDQGFFQISSLLICFSIYRNRFLPLIMILVSGAAVFVTMHRLSWAAWCIALIIIGYNELRTRKYGFASLFLGLAILIMIFSIGTSRISKSAFFQAMKARLYADTLIVRTDYYRFAFDVIRNNPFGIGSYWTSYYSQFAYNKGMPFNYDDYAHPVAFVVHNGFLSAGVLHGIVGFITFSLFVGGNILFYVDKFWKDSNKFLLPFGMSVIFLVYNLTQDFSDFGSQIEAFFGILLAWFASDSIRYLDLDATHRHHKRIPG